MCWRMYGNINKTVTSAKILLTVETTWTLYLCLYCNSTLVNFLTRKPKYENGENVGKTPIKQVY